VVVVTPPSELGVVVTHPSELGVVVHKHWKQL